MEDNGEEMNEFPLVIVLLITYERTEVALTTIRGIKERIRYPNLGWHIADDGSNGGHIEKLVEEIGADYEITTSNTGGHSVGKNMNEGIARCLERADMWLHWEDDWVPNMEIELIPCVELFQENEEIGMVRLGRLQTDLYGHVITGGDRLWWRLDKEKQLWTWVGHAAMRHRRFHDAYGIYPEGQTPGITELGMQSNVMCQPGPDIVWPAWLRYDICDHIGDGYSFKEALENRGLTREEASKEFLDKLEALKVSA